MRAVLLGLLAAALLSDNADAQPNESANFVVPMCEKYLEVRSPPEGKDALETTWGMGFSYGVFMGLTYVANGLPPHLSSCLPKGVTIAQSARVALAYIERYPQRMQEDFRDYLGVREARSPPAMETKPASGRPIKSVTIFQP
jgi:hypothetical protein